MARTGLRSSKKKQNKVEAVAPKAAAVKAACIKARARMKSNKKNPKAKVSAPVALPRLLGSHELSPIDLSHLDDSDTESASGGSDNKEEVNGHEEVEPAPLRRCTRSSTANQCTTVGEPAPLRRRTCSLAVHWRIPVAETAPADEPTLAQPPAPAVNEPVIVRSAQRDRKVSRGK
ncbi:uncharacterized protein LOC62_03G004358 [Vanrija pseudolonga]|uniref:Uncharacterized protein n=1 Tax=Vanrija pseudolonga TaxID=143232 RepID=A0AAF0Y670_9TREE|nr:hypothetical protein LOC62_03G004358 [Vanrija pseudolonga]